MTDEVWYNTKLHAPLCVAACTHTHTHVCGRILQIASNDSTGTGNSSADSTGNSTGTVVVTSYVKARAIASAQRAKSNRVAGGAGSRSKVNPLTQVYADSGLYRGVHNS